MRGALLTLGVALAALGLALAALGPAAARADCSGVGTPRWQAHQTLVGLLNPLGAEHNLRVGLCVPLYRSDDRALSANRVELGASSYFSPVYLMGGAYAQVAPASFFYARVELNGIGIWPVPIDGAGYFPMAGYTAPFRDADVPASRGGSAAGWGARFIAVLRGAVDVGPVRVLALDALAVDHEEVGGAAYWLDVRNDLVVARSDWVLTNEAVVLAGVRLAPGLELRFGPYDTLRDVPAAGYVAHQVGGLVMLAWERPLPGVDALEVFLRVGFHTDHAVRAGEATTLGGAGADHDLGGL